MSKFSRELFLRNVCFPRSLIDPFLTIQSRPPDNSPVLNQHHTLSTSRNQRREPAVLVRIQRPAAAYALSVPSIA
eukprot:2029545-Rhodomonas_salina.2